MILLQFDWYHYRCVSLALTCIVRHQRLITLWFEMSHQSLVCIPYLSCGSFTNWGMKWKFLTFKYCVQQVFFFLSLEIFRDKTWLLWFTMFGSWILCSVKTWSKYETLYYVCLHCKLHHAYCAIHITLYTSNYAHCCLHIAPCPLHHAHCTMPIALWKL